MPDTWTNGKEVIALATQGAFAEAAGSVPWPYAILGDFLAYTNSQTGIWIRIWVDGNPVIAHLDSRDVERMHRWCKITQAQNRVDMQNS